MAKEKEKQKPMVVYVIQGNGEQSFWNRCGIAFRNKDDSLNLQVAFFPGLNLQIREQIED